MTTHLQIRKLDHNQSFIEAVDVRDAFFVPRIGDTITLDESGDAYKVKDVNIHYGDRDPDAENIIVWAFHCNDEGTSILNVL